MPRLSSAITPSRRRGFTLTEMAIVLGIIGLILGSIWVASSKVSDNNKLELAQQEAAFIFSNYKNLFAARGMDSSIAAGADLTCSAAVNGVSDGFFPPSMISTTCVDGTTTTYPANPWGGYVQVKADSDPATQSISIGFAGLPTASCAIFASQSPNTADIVKVIINSGTARTPPVTYTTSVTDCSAASNMVQVFYKVR